MKKHALVLCLLSALFLTGCDGPDTGGLGLMGLMGAFGVYITSVIVALISKKIAERKNPPTKMSGSWISRNKWHLILMAILLTPSIVFISKMLLDLPPEMKVSAAQFMGAIELIVTYSGMVAIATLIPNIVYILIVIAFQKEGEKKYMNAPLYVTLFFIACMGLTFLLYNYTEMHGLAKALLGFWTWPMAMLGF